MQQTFKVSNNINILQQKTKNTKTNGFSCGEVISTAARIIANENVARCKSRRRLFIALTEKRQRIVAKKRKKK